MATASRPLPDYLIERYRAWRRLRFEDNRAWFARLAEEGQRPRSMVISCCDSRVDAVSLFGAEPGDMFVVRNVANMAPPPVGYHGHHGTLAAVEFAVTALRVAHIVVLGHSRCGGVEACYDMCSGAAPQFEGGDSHIGRWMELLRPAYQRIAEAPGDRAARLTALEREGVLHSLSNLRALPFVAAALEEGRLALHGAWIDIAEGALWMYDPAEGAFVAVEGEADGAS